MRKEIRIISEDGKSVQITTPDERFYAFDSKAPDTGLPQWEFVPSVTWIASFYPKGQEYFRWLANHGMDEAERIKEEAGDRGTIVHRACEILLKDGGIDMTTKVLDHKEEEREMAPDEYYCVMTFAQWYNEMGRPKVKSIERTVRSREHNFAGTLDLFLEEDNHLIDIKTSKYIWPSHKVQLSGLKQALEEEGQQVDKTSVLQLGYTLNKTKHYKLTEITPDFNLFLAVKDIWKNETSIRQPRQMTYPLTITL